MSDSIDAVMGELAAALQDIAVARGATRVTFSVAGIADRVSGEVALSADGVEIARAPLDAFDELRDLLVRFRPAAALVDRGTWFIATAWLEPFGEASFDLDDMTEPPLDVRDADVLADQQRYPRSPEHRPPWFAERLERAEASHDGASGRRTVRFSLSGGTAPSPAQSPAAQSPAAQSPAAQSPAAQSPATPPSATPPPAAQSPAAQSPAASTPPSAGGGADGPRTPASGRTPDAFLEVVRDAVRASPDQLSLRVELVRLLCEHAPIEAFAEIDALADRGADPALVARLRADTVEALARHGAASTGPGGAASELPGDARRAIGPHDAAGERGAAPSDGGGRGTGGREDVVPVSATAGSEGRFWEVERPAISLADVVGLEDVKRQLELSFTGPLRNPALARQFGRAATGGLLMYGPPGCGKTFLARAVAGELGLNFLSASAADLFGPYIGESERAIQDLFRAARANRPSVVFLDEFDSLGGRRGSGSSGAQVLRAVVSQLLAELDGVRDSNDGLYFLAATNRPWDIDHALRRPGRIDRTVLVLPPDAPAREAILRQGLAKVPSGDVDVRALAARTEGLSGADLVHLLRVATEQAFSESLRTGVGRDVQQGDLLLAASQVVPSTRSWFEEMKPTLDFGVDDGTFRTLRTYLRTHRI